MNFFMKKNDYKINSLKIFLCFDIMLTLLIRKTLRIKINTTTAHNIRQAMMVTSLSLEPIRICIYRVLQKVN